MEKTIEAPSHKEGLVAEIKRMYELSEKDGFESVRATAMFLANFAEEISYLIMH